jgi:hypothetical protein
MNKEREGARNRSETWFLINAPEIAAEDLKAVVLLLVKCFFCKHEFSSLPLNVTRERSIDLYDC